MIYEQYFRGNNYIKMDTMVSLASGISIEIFAGGGEDQG